MLVAEKARAGSDHTADKNAHSGTAQQTISAMVLGVGAFAYSTAQILNRFRFLMHMQTNYEYTCT